MDSERIVDLWTRATRIDPTLALNPRSVRPLARREVTAVSYSRRKLFHAMAAQEIILFSNFPLRATLGRFFLGEQTPADRIKALFEPDATTLVKQGPAQKRRYLKVHDVVDTWQRNRATASANDIFYRHLQFDRIFDCSSITDYNILLDGGPHIQELEVATMLLGTVGCMSDSHSDDPDGLNHCVMGAKLWLVWDRCEGQAKDLQDCEYDDVYSHSHFDMKTFLSLASARWFVVGPGLTLFLPGNHTHKVITLERYLGISSFYVTLANALSSLSRWRLRPTNMIDAAAWNEIADLVSHRLRATADASAVERRTWGFDHLREAAQLLSGRLSAGDKARLRADSEFMRLAGLAGQMAALSRDPSSPFA